MTINDLPELSIEWLESLERSNLREKGRRILYKTHYSSKMSYERFVYIQNLEQEVLWYRLDEGHARDMIKQFDKDHPEDKYC